MNVPEARCFAFERFHFDPMRGVLSNALGPTEMRPKSLAVLHYLVAHPQRLVGKDELLAAVWGKVIVTEDSLVQCVREIRLALGDTDQRIIRTIPRSGYMFTAAVKAESAISAAESPALPEAPAPTMAARTSARLRSIPWLTALAALLVALGVAWVVAPGGGRLWLPGSAGAPVAPPMSIVVLPLVNIGGDPQHEYFAQGLTNDLTTDLGRVPEAQVVSASSARAFVGREADIGRELGVRYVVEGSVQRIGESLRVNLRLIDTAQGVQRWAERFEVQRSELPQLQVDIVRRIGQTLGLRLLQAEVERSARERTADSGAQELLMRGWWLWEQRRSADNAQARELFTRSVAIDPNYSLAWVGLANTHLTDLHAGWSADKQVSLAQASRAIELAYEVGPRHREVNAVRGYVLFFQGDIEAALTAFDREIEVNAGNALAHVWRGLMLVSLARPAQALPEIERGIQLSPRDIDLNVFFRSMAHACFSLGRFGDAVSWSQRAVVHTPGYVKGYAFLAASAALDGDHATAANALEAFRRLQPKFGSIAEFQRSMMPGEVRMFDNTPRFWEGLERAGLRPE